MFEGAETLERASFPSVSPASAALGNCLAARALSFDATIMEEKRCFTLSMESAAPDASGLFFCCHIGECAALISISDDQARALLPTLAGDVAIKELPEPLIMAIATTALRPVLAGLAVYLGLPFSLDKLHDGESFDWPSLMLREGEGGHGAPVAAFYVDPARLDSFTNAIAAMSPGFPWSGVDSVLFRIETEFWRTAMPARELADLESGDVVLLPEGYPADRVTLIAGDKQEAFGTGRRDGASITVEELKGIIMADHSEADLVDDHDDDADDDDEAFDDEDLDEDDDDSDEDAEEDLDDAEPESGEGDAGYAASAGGPLGADDLDVKVSFSLGHGMVSIADLRAVAPGYVFNLENEPGAEVAVIAGGREVGRGEIVQIADRLGVRIVKLKGGSDAKSS